MRVIISKRMWSEPGSAPTPAVPPLFATGKVHEREDGVVYVSGTPHAQNSLVGFRLSDGSFAYGQSLDYLDWYLHNIEEVAAYLDSQPIEKAVDTKAYERQAAVQQGVATARGIPGLTSRI